MTRGIVTRAEIIHDRIGTRPVKIEDYVRTLLRGNMTKIKVNCDFRSSKRVTVERRSRGGHGPGDITRNRDLVTKIASAHGSTRDFRMPLVGQFEQGQVHAKARRESMQVRPRNEQNELDRGEHAPRITWPP